MFILVFHFSIFIEKCFQFTVQNVAIKKHLLNATLSHRSTSKRTANRFFQTVRKSDSVILLRHYVKRNRAVSDVQGNRLIMYWLWKFLTFLIILGCQTVLSLLEIRHVRRGFSVGPVICWLTRQPLRQSTSWFVLPFHQEPTHMKDSFAEL